MLSWIRWTIVALAGCGAIASAQTVTQPASRPAKIEVAAIYFPGYHRDSHYDEWFGPGWDEWQLLMTTKSRFPGHRHLKPAWGAFDEADPAMMTRQIDLAVRFGIDVFIFDWYWYSGTKILHRPLEEAFLKVHNRDRLKFALMWANHPWKNYFPAPLGKEPPLLLPMQTSPEDFGRIIAYGIEHYFREPNYWRVGGGPYFSLFDTGTFIQQIGGPQKTRELFEQVRRQVASAGLGRLHIAGFDQGGSRVDALREAGFDSVTTYNICSSPKASLPDHPLDEYSDVIDAHVKCWKEMDGRGIPYSPVVTIGWDPSPRWVPETPWPPPAQGYPYTTVAVHNTPDLFGKLCRYAVEHVQSAKLRPPAIVINAWNEWTEGSALLPDREYGTRYLEEAYKAFKPLRDAVLDHVR